MLKRIGWQGLLFSLLILTLNINKVIYFGEGVKFNATLSDVFLPSIGLVLLIFAVKHKNASIFKYLNVFIALILWIVFTGVFNFNNSEILNQGYMGIFEEVIKTIVCIAYFWAGNNTLRYINEKLVVKILKGSLFIFIFLGIIIFSLAQQNINIMGTNSNYAVYYMGTDTDPNHAAMFLTIMFFFVGALFQTNNTRRALVINSLLLGFISVAIVLTGSRGGLVGFIVGLIIILALNSRKHKKHVITIFLLISILMLVVINIDTLLFHDAFSTRIINKIIGFSDGFEVRYNLSRVALEMGLDHPFTGVGRGNFALNKDYYFNLLSLQNRGDIPHNTFLGLFAEVGIIGLILFGIPIFILIKKIIEIYRKKNMYPYIIIEKFPWFMAIGSTIAVQSLVLNVENRRFLWFLVGLFIAYLDRISDNSIEKNNCEPVNSKINGHKQINVQYHSKLLTRVLIVIIVPLWIFTCLNERIDKVYYNVKDSYNYIIPLRIEKENQDITFITSLYAQAEDKVEKVIKVKIIEKKTDGSIRIVVEEDYPSVKGNFIYSISDVSAGSVLTVEYTKINSKLSSFSVLPLDVVKGNRFKKLNEFYFLQPPIIKSLIEELYWTDDINHQPMADFINIGTNISDQFKIELISSELQYNGILVKMQLVALQDIKYSYKFWAIGYPNDMHNIDVSRYFFGYESYDTRQSIDTKGLNIRNVLEVEFRIPRDYGEYRLEIGLNYYDHDIYKALQLDEYGNTRLPIGKVNFDFKNKGELDE